MTKELTMIKWILEAKIQGQKNAKEYYLNVMEKSEGEKRKYAEELCQQCGYALSVLEKALNEIKESVEVWE